MRRAVPTSEARTNTTPPSPNPGGKYRPQNRLASGHTQQLIRANTSPTLRIQHSLQSQISVRDSLSAAGVLLQHACDRIDNVGKANRARMECSDGFLIGGA